MSNTTQHVSVGSALGTPLLILAIVFLASVGACGKSCQGCTQEGIRTTAQAIRGQQ